MFLRPPCRRRLRLIGYGQLVGQLPLSDPSPLQSTYPQSPVARGFYSPHGGIDLTRATMQLRLAGQARVEEKRIAELRDRLKENLSLLDRERTCRELTRAEGERIKTSLGTAHVRREIPPPTRG